MPACSHPRKRTYVDRPGDFRCLDCNHTGHEPRLQSRLTELDSTLDRYRGTNAQYADLIRSTVSVARLAIAEVVAERAALEEAHDRALDRKDEEIARLRATTTLAEMRAAPDDDDRLVRASFDQPLGGWRTKHLQEMYVRLTSAGSDDHDVVDISCLRDDRHRVSGLVLDASQVVIALEPNRPAPLRVDPPQFDMVESGAFLWPFSRAATIASAAVLTVLTVIAVVVSVLVGVFT